VCGPRPLVPHVVCLTAPNNFVVLGFVRIGYAMSVVIATWSSVQIYAIYVILFVESGIFLLKFWSHGWSPSSIFGDFPNFVLVLQFLDERHLW